jgi:shikimate dehydrogenase
MSSADLYAVIGHPVAHSRSPFIHERFARQVGHDIRYTRIDASPEALSDTVRSFFAGGGKGLNVTLPHKQSVMALVAELSPRAARAGAVNTLALRTDGSLFGDNTDGLGLARDLVYNHRVSIAGRRVLMLGAGGAARGVMMPLLGLQPRELVIANRTPERALEIVEAFRDTGTPLRGCGFDDLHDGPYDIVINATATSIAGRSLPLPPGLVDTHSFCYDMGYGREDTLFVRWARERGCARTAMGLGMLVEQAAESFYLWRGVRPDTAPVLAALKAELAAEG